MSKPINLIVANVMHEACDTHDGVTKAVFQIEKATKEKARPWEKDFQEFVARKLLCEIAHDGDLKTVFQALEAVGAPASNEMVMEGLQAVKDRKCT